jgi:ribosomal protein S18 acetylase RimI-like enzyme
MTTISSTKLLRADTVELRPPTDRDLNDLMDIDLKCFATPWQYDDWVIGGPDAAISLATWGDRVVGFAAGRHTIEESESFFLLKIGVRKHHRLYGIGARLMQAMADYATVRGYQQMHTILAESLAYDVHGWLAKFGFKATGVINEAFHNYGIVEDGIRFDRQL